MLRNIMQNAQLYRWQKLQSNDLAPEEVWHEPDTLVNRERGSMMLESIRIRCEIIEIIIFMAELAA